MSTTKAILLAMNPSLFSFRQPSLLHDIYVVGIKTTDPNDATKKIVNFIQKSKPNEAAKAAGIKPSEFIHTSFKPSGTIKVDEVSNEETFSGPKKAQVGVVFQSAQPDLYNFIAKAIELGEGVGYEKSGEIQMTQEGKTFKRPQIRLKRKMWGRIVAMNVPEYTPTTMGADGKFHALKPVTLNPTTGKYVPTEVVMGSIKFFADDDDLDLLEEAAARIVDKRVKPFAKDRTTFTTENAFGQKKVVVEEAANTGDAGELEAGAVNTNLNPDEETE